jgi:plastocyanin
MVSLVVLSLAGCGSSSRSASPAVSVQAMTHPKIVPNPSGHPDAWYRPDPIRVRVGQAITWTNQDNDPHDVTADGGAFASGPIPAGGVFRWVPTQPGTYTYFCTLHPEMHGVVIVSR